MPLALVFWILRDTKPAFKDFRELSSVQKRQEMRYLADFLGVLFYSS